MKRILKWIGGILGVVVLAVALLLVYINFFYQPHYAVSVPTIHVESTPERLTRGRELVLTLCAECHRDPVTRQLTGRKMGDLPEMFGVAYSRNITKDPVHGIGAWSDGEIVWLLRTGIHPKTGAFVPPWMVKLTGMADEDVYSIVSFLRSDHPLVQAASTENKDSKASLFAKCLTFVGAFKPYEYPKSTILRPDTSNMVVYGKYVANGMFGCYDCHSADFASNDRMVPENSAGFYGGGNLMPDYEKLMIPTKNITPSMQHGIGSWTEQQFVNTMKSGFRPDGSMMRYPMVRLAHVPEFELRAMYAYLRSIPAIEKSSGIAQSSTVPVNAGPGQQLYYTRGCVHCHGANGLAYADLQLAHKKFPDDSTLAQMILAPETVYPETVMPHWGGHLSNDEALALAAFVRSLGQQSGR